jgi:hypothetical protein
MPRNLHITPPWAPTRVPAILRTEFRKTREQIHPTSPRLWNAKRRIKGSRGLTVSEANEYKKDPEDYDWRSKVSPDVAEFYDNNPNLLPEEKYQLLRYPVSYFARPYRVPLSQRKQVYLPEFDVTFLRTPQLGPYYAKFEVPLWFNKLDTQSYLKNVYNVDVVHVRSHVTPSKKESRDPSKGGKGGAYRTPSQKFMTVQLEEPFEWPEEIKELDS